MSDVTIELNGKRFTMSAERAKAYLDAGLGWKLVETKVASVVDEPPREPEPKPRRRVVFSPPTTNEGE